MKQSAQGMVGRGMTTAGGAGGRCRGRNTQVALRHVRWEALPGHPMSSTLVKHLQ